METASVSDRNKKFRGFGRILSMFHRRFFEDCKTTYIVTKEGQPFQWIKKSGELPRIEDQNANSPSAYFT